MKENQTDTTGTAENIQLADPEATKDTETENTGPDPRTDDKDGIEDTRHDGAARENGDTRRETGQQKETDGTSRSPTPKPNWLQYKMLRSEARRHYMMLRTKTTKPEANERQSQPIIWDGGSNNHCFKSEKFFNRMKRCSDTAIGFGGPLRIEATGEATIAFKDFDLTLKNADYTPNAPDNVITPRKLRHIFYKFSEYDDHVIGHFRDGCTAVVARLDPESGLMHCLLKDEERPKKAVHYELKSTKPTRIARYLDYHRSKGHPNREVTMLKAARDNVKLIELDRECGGCPRAKMAESRPKQRDYQSDRAGELLHMDLCGPFNQTASHDGFRYALCIMDDYSGKVFLYSLKTKSEADGCIRKCVAHIERMTERPVKYAHSDNGGEFSSKSLNEHLLEIGLKHITTVPGAHFQNGKVERLNRTLQGKALALMDDLDRKFGTGPNGEYAFPLLVEAFKFAAYRHNETPSKANPGWASPNEMFPEIVPKLKDYQFGDVVCAAIRKQQPKGSYKGERLMMVGFAKDKKAYRLYDPRNSREPITQSERICLANDPDDIELFVRGRPPGSRIRYPPGKENADKQLERKLYALMKIPDENFQPETFEQAARCRESESWLHAMQAENDNILEHNTMTPVKRTDDMRVLPLRWKFKKKVDRFKCRIVVGGHLQIEGVDYDVTFAPTMTLQNVRFFTALGKKLGYYMHSIDIDGAFLNGDIDRDVYVRPSKGMVFSDLPPDYVLKLNKGLYGLHQSGRQWRKKLDETLRRLGFVRSRLAPTVYFKVMPDKTRIYLGAYVDDLLLMGPSESELEAVKEEIGKHFTYKDGGRLAKFIGLEFTETSGGGLRISQTGSIEALARRHECNVRFPKYTLPFAAATILNPSEREDDLLSDGLTDEYRSMVAAMLYIGRGTRFDVCYPISQLARHYEKPHVEHWELAKRLLRFLYQTRFYSLMYSTNPPISLTTHADSDYANRSDLYSYSGVMVQLGNATIYWRTSLQSSRAQSVDEAEVMAANEAARQVIYFKSLASELGLLEGVVPNLKVDNAGVVRISDRGFGERTKHLNLQQLYLHDLRERNLITVDSVTSKKNPADVLTKCCAGGQMINAYQVARMGDFKPEGAGEPE